MSDKDKILVQYVGCISKALVREYTFTVRAAANDPREFTLTIPNEAFNAHRARYQDAPDICSLKLQRELSACTADAVKTHFRITDIELEDYRTAHSPKQASRLYPRKVTQDR